MKIKRELDPATIQQIQQAGKVEFELTAEELREAYLEEQHANHLGDAEAQFEDFFRCSFGSFLDDKAKDRFVKRYGFTADVVEDVHSPHYMLEKFVTAYEKRHDCNDADNDIWHTVIEDLLEEYSKGYRYRCPHCGHALIDSDLSEYDYLCPHCDENFFAVEAVDVYPEQGGTYNG